MSLLDEAKSAQVDRSSGPVACAFAVGIAREFPEAEWPEVIEMMESEEVSGATKAEVLSNHGVVVSKTNILKKIRNGCGCKWCRENWRGRV